MQDQGIRDLLEQQKDNVNRDPDMLQRVVNFAKALGVHVAAGLPAVDDAEKERRLALCQQCLPPEGFFKDGRCMHNKCGCSINRKAAWLDQKCPIGRW